ncbi:hypothetical protein [Phytohabitans suffuscus]|uniref:Uncharacterized protein n=1 Tax=Phytohabitans suffuscus TaxID=624315 RepID=A0A6F8YU06_9ACTN|nr:hypothetical protein [Phytohabitans suffuscus]BCB89594.1 hypothetical protein Psuf_069070 [Phytohabitans suffuscus]
MPRIGVLAANAAAAAAGVLLVLLARGLSRGKRSAWLLTAALAAAASALHLLKGLDVEEAAATAGLLALLVAARHHFRARSDPRARWRAIALAAAAFTTATAFLAGLAGPGTGAALAWLTGG